MIAAALTLLQLQAAPPPPPPQDSLPQVTLAEALRRASRLDPGYVSALGQVGDAAWGRRSARLAFLVPSISFQSSATRYSTEFFNIGTGQLATQIVDAQLSGTYDVFRGGAKIFGLRQADAELDAAEADELAERFRSALDTESDYYAVLAERELTRVARERVRRADEQLAVARARVLAGAAVQTDSLQLLLELTRARVELLRQEAQLKVARLQLGRRVGTAGPVDAAPLDTLPAPAIPLTEVEVAQEALSRSPRSVAARADARAAGAAVASARGGYLPNVTLFGQISSFDDRFFPNATTRSAAGLRISVPIWNNAQREIQLSRAKTGRDAAEAERQDEELAVQRDAVEALLNYNTARAATELAQEGVAVAGENLRVQQERYRAGATTIIDLITAQVALAEAEAGVVQARHATRLALAGLEAILGRRLFEEPGREP